MLISPYSCLRATRRTIERLVQYMTRCPFSLARLVTVNDTGQVIYKAEKDACRAFPDPQADGLESRRAAEFPDPLPARVSLPRQHRLPESLRGAAGLKCVPLLPSAEGGTPLLVFEQEPGHAEEGSASNRVRR